MIATDVTTIKHDKSYLSYPDAVAIARSVYMNRQANLILLDLAQAPMTTTAALAMLVQLRRWLLSQGGDLRLAGLCGRAEAMWELCRLERVLPRHTEAQGTSQRTRVQVSNT